MDAKKATMLAAICGVVVLIGVLMPWYSVSTDFGEVGAPFRVRGMSNSANGTTSPFHGGFVIALALVGGLAAAFLWRGAPKGLPLSARGLAIVAVGAFALATLVTLLDVFRDLPSVSGPGFSAGRGIGMFVTLIAAGAGTFLSFLAMRGTPGSPAAPTPPAS